METSLLEVWSIIDLAVFAVYDEHAILIMKGSLVSGFLKSHIFGVPKSATLLIQDVNPLDRSARFYYINRYHQIIEIQQSNSLSTL